MPMGQCALTLRARAKAAGALRQKRNAKCRFPPCFNKAVAGGSICQECSDVLWMQRAGFGDMLQHRQTTSPDDVVTNGQHRPRDDCGHFEEQQNMEMFRRQGAIPRRLHPPPPPPPPRDSSPPHRSEATRLRHVDASPAEHNSRLQRRDEENDVSYALRVPDHVTEQPTQSNRHDTQRRTDVSRHYTLNRLNSHELHGHDDDALPRDEHHDEGPSSSLLVSGVTTSLCLDYDDE